ncbi:3'-to-5' exoribonuclease RNase R, partial [hydrothermal vent metagenome]
RAMQQARYSAENHGHFGLASEYYTHFTSPIRRYPDLIVHRLLKRIFRAEMPEIEKETWAKKLPEMARHCSERERVAVDAERDVIRRKQAKFMADKVGEKYEGIISGVTSYGLFVQLETYFVEGLAHISSLQGDYYIHDEKRHALIGRNFKRIYRLGQAVRVEVDDVDMEQQKINFRILAAPRRHKLIKAESKPKSKPKTKPKQKKKSRRKS